jgi:hypothetical protein
VAKASTIVIVTRSCSWHYHLKYIANVNETLLFTKIGQTLPAAFVGDEEEKMEPHQVGEEQEEEEQGPKIISC